METLTTDIEKHLKELFLDLSRHTDINPPQTVSTYQEMEERVKPGHTLFLVKDEPILAHLNENENLFYFTKNVTLLSLLQKMGDAIVLPKEEYPFRLIHIIVLHLNGYTPAQKPYDKIRSDFLNKIFYFFEIPVDGYILSQHNVYPDIEATSLDKLV